MPDDAGIVAIKWFYAVHLGSQDTLLFDGSADFVDILGAAVFRRFDLHHVVCGGNGLCQSDRLPRRTASRRFSGLGLFRFRLCRCGGGVGSNVLGRQRVGLLLLLQHVFLVLHGFGHLDADFVFLVHGCLSFLSVD